MLHVLLVTALSVSPVLPADSVRPVLKPGHVVSASTADFTATMDVSWFAPIGTNENS